MKTKTYSILSALLISTFCQGAMAQTVSIVPKPVSAKYQSGYFKETNPDAIAAKTEKKLDKKLRSKLGGEGYKLSVTEKKIVIEAASDTGLFYGGETVRQLTTDKGVRCATITDYPRFSYRGIHTDVSRHFFSKEEIMKILDEMAYYKLNNFHFHLTDNGGWRIQIDGYPKLTELGSYRVMKDWDGWWKLDHRYFCTKDTPGAYGGYYTKDDIRQIVAYAQKRYINVIPEIEFPAHSDPVFVGYPELNCTKTQYDNGEFCPANEEVYKFAKTVLKEVMELFPSKVIHIGDDEAMKTAWAHCPACQKLMQEKGMKTTEDLQIYMMERLKKFLNDNGRVMGGWDELLKDPKMSSSVIVYSYRGEKGGITAANRGIKAVMTPGEILYFDWYQASPKEEEKAMYGYSPIKKMFIFDPQPITPERAAFNESLVEGKKVSADTVAYIRPEMKKFIIGVQGCAWAEYIPNEKHLEYMMFPRLLAIAEKGWSAEGGSTWEEFKTRLGDQLKGLQERGINAYDLHDAPEVTTEGKKIFIESENPSAVVRYTLDGSDPSSDSDLYKGPLTIKDNKVTVKAAAFVGDKRASYVKITNVVRGEIVKEYYPYICADR
jgi:hexosaminidase